MKQKNVLTFKLRSIHTIAEKAKQRLLAFAIDQRGASAVDIIIGIVISVATAAVLIGLLNAALPNLFSSIVNKISTMLGI